MAYPLQKQQRPGNRLRQTYERPRGAARATSPGNRGQAGGWTRSLTLLAHLLNLAQAGNDLKTADVGFCDSQGSLVSPVQLPRGGCAHRGVLARLLGGFGREEPNGESNLNASALS